MNGNSLNSLAADRQLMGASTHPTLLDHLGSDLPGHVLQLAKIAGRVHIGIDVVQIGSSLPDDTGKARGKECTPCPEFRRRGCRVGIDNAFGGVQHGVIAASMISPSRLRIFMMRLQPLRPPPQTVYVNNPQRTETGSSHGQPRCSQNRLAISLASALDIPVMAPPPTRRIGSRRAHVRDKHRRSRSFRTQSSR